MPDMPPSGDRGANPHLELEYQAGRADTMRDLRPTPIETLQRYKENRRWKSLPVEGMFRALGDLEGKSVLDFGCGEGVYTTELAWLGAGVTGVDLSPELIEVAQRRVELDGTAERVRLIAGDILEMDHLAGSFDVVLCNAVLHHVPLETVFDALLRLAKPGGAFVILEPVAFSKRLQAIRDRVPVEKDASPEERQLDETEIDYLTSRLRDVEMRFYHLTTRLARLAPTAALEYRSVLALGVLDWLLLKVRPLRRFAGTVLIRGRVPAD